MVHVLSSTRSAGLAPGVDARILGELAFEAISDRSRNVREHAPGCPVLTVSSRIGGSFTSPGPDTGAGLRLARDR
jgi:hypothetical protein